MGIRKRRGNNYCLEQTLWFRDAGDNGPLRRPPCTLLVQSSGQTSAPSNHEHLAQVATGTQLLDGWRFGAI